MATWRYKKPDAKGHSGYKALLKYVTYREDAHHVVPENGVERWHDGGLGRNWREVFATSQKLAGQYILAHHFVLAPDPDLMALLPEDRHRDALHKLTIQTLTDWYHARDLAMPEASFVIHDRETTDAAAPGRQMLHAHLFCAGSVPTLAGRECPMVKERDVVRNKGGLDRETNLNRIAEQNWAALLDREIGLDWRIGRDLERHVAGATGVLSAAPQVEHLPTLQWDLPNIDHAALTRLLTPDAEPAPAFDEDAELNSPNRSFDIGFF